MNYFVNLGVARVLRKHLSGDRDIPSRIILRRDYKSENRFLSEDEF